MPRHAHRVRRVLISLGLVLAYSGAAAPAQGATLSFSAQQTLSTGGTNADVPQVGVDANGGAVVIWREFDGSNYRIRAATRSARGFFGPSAFISKAGLDASNPKLVVARDGTAIASWTQPQTDVSSGYDITTAVRPPGGAFAAPVVQTNNTSSFGLLDMAMDRNGNTLLLVARYDSATQTSVHFISRLAGGNFSGTIQVWTRTSDFSTTGVGVTGGDIAFDAQGDALATWIDNPAASSQDGFGAEIRAVQRRADGTLETQQLVGIRNGNQIYGPHASITATRSAVSWSRQISGSSGSGRYATRTGLGGGAWSAEKDAVGDGSFVNAGSWISRAEDGAGNVLASGITTNNGAQETSRDLWLDAGATTFSPVRTLPAGITRPAFAFDDSGLASLIYRNGSELFFAQRGSGPSGAYTAAVDLGARDSGETLGVGPDGTAAVVWVINDGGNTRVVTRLGDVVVPPGSPSPSPPPGSSPSPPVSDTPPPAPEPPVPSPIQVAGKLTAGRAAVLTVAVAGTTTSLEWTVGSRGPFVATPVNGVLGRSIRLRFEGSVKVSVRAVGPGGTNVIARTLAAPAAPDDADARKVSAGEPSSASPVVALGPEDVLTGRSSACGPLIVRTGARTLTGCGRPIDELGDMPGGERGVLAPIASAYRLNGADAALMSRAVELLDGFVFDGALAIDGLWPVTPGPGARLVAYPQAQALASSNASIRVAGQPLRPRGKGFLLPVGAGAGDIELGPVSAPSGFPKLGGFPYAGDLDVALGRAFASVDTRIKLPDFATRNGIGLTPRASLRASPDRLIDADGLTYGPADVSFGPIPLRGFVVRYNAADDRWDGGMSACVFGAGCVDFQSPAGGIRLKGNELVYAKAGVDYGSPGRPLAPGIFLESGGFGFGLNPSRLLASARLGFGTFVKVDGREVLAWPSTSAPYRLARDEVGDAFPASLYASSFTNPLVAAGADLSVDLPVVGETKLAGGYLLFESGGYLALGGSASLDVLGVVKLSGSVSGESSLTRVNVHGDIRACLTAVDDDLCAAAVSNISRGVGNEGGAGACMQLGPVSVGGGVLWSQPGLPKVWPLDGCRWSPFRLDVRGARAAQAGGGTSVVVRSGQPGQAIQLTGAGESPQVRVTGPGGRALDTSAGRMAVSADRRVRIMRVDTATAHFTVVGLDRAAPGSWRIEPLPASAAITKVGKASDPPAARITGRVARAGDRRVLTWTALGRPAQRISFFDVAPGGARQLIGTSKATKGHLRWSPSPGRAAHRVIAAFELDGLPAEERTVARFAPPKPTLPRVSGLAVRRRGARLTVTWKPVAGAKRYELSLTSAATQRFASTRRRRTTFAKVPLTSPATVTVRAVDELRRGPVASRTVKRAKQSRKGLKGLGNCRVRGKRVTCRRG